MVGSCNFISGFEFTVTFYGNSWKLTGTPSAVISWMSRAQMLSSGRSADPRDDDDEW